MTAATTELASPEVTGPDGRTSLGAELPRQVAARALADAAAIIVWGWLATALARVLIAPDQFDVGAYLTVLLVVALVACLYALPVVRRSADLLTPVTLLGMVVLAGAIAAFDAQAPHPFFIPNPAVSLVGAAALVTGLMLGTWLGVVSVVALTLWHGWWEFGAPSGATSGGYLASLVTAATNFAGARFVASSLVHSARQVGGMLTRLLAERRADQLRRVHENSRVRALTDVHDTVLTTLSGVGGGWLSSSDPAALRAELNRDLQVLDDLAEPQETGPVDLAEALRGLVRSSRFSSLDVRVDAPTSVLVDADVADELTLAAREALVNVVKHADVAAASVELSERDGTLEIVVRDEGRGALDALGHGLGTRGIAARMAEVGGQATLTSTPGSGTTVTLTRPQRPVGAVPPLWSVEGPLRGTIGLTAVAAVATTVAFALQAPGYADLGPHLWALLVAIVADALAIGVVLRQRRMPGWLSALLIAAIAVVLLLPGWALPGCESMGYAHFAGGGQVVMCVVITLLRPWGEAVAALLAYAVGYVALAAPLYAAGESCGITALNQTGTALSYVVAGIWFTRALNRHAGIAASVLAAEEELIAGRAARQARAAERRRLFPIVRGIVTDTIAGLVDGRLDPADPDVRLRCRRDARLVRGFLTQAGDADHLVTDFFTRSMTLRDAGIDLAVRGTLPRGTVPRDQRDALVDGLSDCLRLITDEGWAGEAWVTFLRTDDGVLVTLVLHRLPAGLEGDRVREALLRHAVPGLTLDRVDTGDRDLWLTCRLAAPPTVPQQTGAPA